MMTLPVAALSDYGLFCGHLVAIVGVVLAAEKEGEGGVVSLLAFGHLLKFRTVSSHELRKLIDDVAHLLIVGRLRQLHTGQQGVKATSTRSKASKSNLTDFVYLREWFRDFFV